MAARPAPSVWLGAGWAQNILVTAQNQTQHHDIRAYALVRNPIYIGNTSSSWGSGHVRSPVDDSCGPALVWNSVFLVVRYEEQQLAVKYGGEYLDYLAAVRRWLPFPTSPSGKARFSSPQQILLAELYVVCIIVAPLLKEFIVAPFPSKPVAICVSFPAVWLGLFASPAGYHHRDQSDGARFASYMAVHLSSYVRLADPLLLTIVARSLWTACATTALCLVIGYPLAYFIVQQRAPVRTWLYFLTLLPLWANSLVLTYAWMVLLRVDGVADQGARLLGWLGTHESLNWLYTPGAVIAGLVYWYLPFMVYPIYGALEKFDWRLFEAAQDLGATRVVAFFKVLLPLTWPGVLAALHFIPVGILWCHSSAVRRRR
jgi:ABC-type spermidine/putrescine transport system permease subunit I